MSMSNAEEIKQTVRGFLQRSVGLTRLDDDDDLFDSGIVNSLFAVQLMTFIEKTYGIRVATEDLEIENFKSLNATTAFVLRKTGAAHAAAAD
jgi:methoxymalonate biosynthesis acyl carrier protein